jgi:hypothetical protein
MLYIVFSVADCLPGFPYERFSIFYMVEANLRLFHTIASLNFYKMGNLAELRSFPFNFLMRQFASLTFIDMIKYIYYKFKGRKK